jgi:hypothetical protein
MNGVFLMEIMKPKKVACWSPFSVSYGFVDACALERGTGSSSRSFGQFSHLAWILFHCHDTDEHLYVIVVSPDKSGPTQQSKCATNR